MATPEKKGKRPSSEFVELDLTEEDFGGSFAHSRGLWLGGFTPEQVVSDLESHGIFQHLAQRGYTNIKPEIDCEGFESRLIITGEHCRKSEPQLLVEVEARLTNSKVLSQLEDRSYSSLIFDWVLFQDPCAEFDDEHPQLPGQKHPGLDLLQLGTQLMFEQVKQLPVELVLNHPRHFHNAVFYSSLYRFLDPLSEGHLRALKRDLLGTRTLADVSRALDAGEVLDHTGNPVVWKQNVQAWPRDKKIEESLFGSKYMERMEQASKEKFRFA